jgi:hypothetical protein
MRKIGWADLVAAVSAKELDQPVCGREISPDGMRRPAAIMLKMAGPANGKLRRRVKRQF